ncbi:acyl-CoA thioesterase [Nonomuraea africana]|uniref:Enediyne biosynthesis thioesterase n=1 Tax=Nonomuraea africana TaxID=46171 RepID=A0ABR9KEQ9_9ACTN|nr:acyl-CoA thioesterase [Nonomuraea africana]MBE1560508.1 enediyne biosynthesis thioesterase [Nonomuraea africana]
MRPYYAYEHLVTFADTNLVGNVYFAKHLTWQGECRERFLAEHTPEILAQLGDDLAMVTLACSCDYFGELYAFDRVSIRMTLSGLDHNRVTMDFAYYRVNIDPAQLVARGSQTIACMLRTDRGLAPVAVPGQLRRALERYSDQLVGGGVQ